jgi:flagellar biosynthesis component FlhA
MRSLLAEQVSVSDFATLIEVLAEQSVELQEKVDDGIWSDRADSVQEGRDRVATAAARRRLSRQVAAKVVHEGVEPSMPAVVLDPGLYQAISARAEETEPVSPDDDERLNASVAAYLAEWPGDRWPALLTNARIRGAVSAALAPQFPGLAVVAYEEIPVDVALDLVGEVNPAETQASDP